MPLIAYKSKEKSTKVKEKKPESTTKRRFDDEDGEYVDYEEIK